MTIAQYRAALLTDYSVKISATTIHYAREDGRIEKDMCGSFYGKRCINYTDSAKKLLDNLPKIDAPALKKGNIPPSNRDEKPLNEDEDYSLAREKALHEHIKRKKAELEYSIIEGNYLSVEDVQTALTIIGIETRQAIFSLIPRNRALLAAEKDPHKITELLESEFTIALGKLDNISSIVETLDNDDDDMYEDAL